MSPKEIQKRNVKAENLRVLQSEDGQFFVGREKGESFTMLYWVKIPIHVHAVIMQRI